MVEISLSGSGEGLGGQSAPGATRPWCLYRSTDEGRSTELCVVKSERYWESCVVRRESNWWKDMRWRTTSTCV